MTYLTFDEPSEVAYLIPIGDIHIGDKAFGRRGKQKLMGYLDWCLERPNSRILLMGDIFNVASRTSKTSPFTHNSDELQMGRDLFAPYKERILGAIDGNHEMRVTNEFGISILNDAFCIPLGIPYCKASTVVRVRVGARPGATFHQTYHCYAHHTCSGGRTLGAAINTIVRLQEIVHGMDVYLGGHNHQLVSGPRVVWVPDRSKMRAQEMHFVDCGSYLDWEGSYAEEKMLPMGKLGSPRIRFSGQRSHHDVHVSI